MRRAREAVVAHDAVGDEVAGAGRDVVEPHVQPERLDRRDACRSRRLQRHAGDRALARDRRADRVEEPQMLREPAADADVAHARSAEPRPRRRLEPEVSRTRASVEDLAVRAADPEAPWPQIPRHRRCRPGTPCASRRSGRVASGRASAICSTPRAAGAYRAHRPSPCDRRRNSNRPVATSNPARTARRAPVPRRPRGPAGRSGRPRAAVGTAVDARREVSVAADDAAQVSAPVVRRVGGRALKRPVPSRLLRAVRCGRRSGPCSAPSTYFQPRCVRKR